jgi:HEAT repeat protein
MDKGSEMKKKSFVMLILTFLLVSCGQELTPVLPTQTATQAPTSTSTSEPTIDTVGLLIANLEITNDVEVRHQAAVSLGQIKDPRSVAPLIAALADSYPYILEPVEAALINIGDPAFEPLIEALKNQDLNIRCEAATILGRINNPIAIEPIIATLKDSRMEYCISYVLSQMGAPAVEPLIEALKDENMDVRSSAAFTLGEMNDPRAVGPLIASLEDKGYERMSAVSALGKIEDPQAIRAVYLALKDEGLYESAKNALLKVDGAYAIGPSIEALGDENEQVRFWADIVLQQIGVQAVDYLMAALKDENPDVRKSAALQLGQLKDQRAIEPLLIAVKDENLEVRRAALYSLLGFGDARADEPIMTALKNEDLAFIAEFYDIFIRKGVNGSEPVLIKALDQYGTKTMAEDFLNCGNSLLVEAATTWAKTHGFTITQVSGSGGPGWGINR